MTIQTQSKILFGSVMASVTLGFIAISTILIMSVNKELKNGTNKEPIKIQVELRILD